MCAMASITTAIRIHRTVPMKMRLAGHVTVMTSIAARRGRWSVAMADLSAQTAQEIPLMYAMASILTVIRIPRMVPTKRALAVPVMAMTWTDARKVFWNVVMVASGVPTEAKITSTCAMASIMTVIRRLLTEARTDAGQDRDGDDADVVSRAHLPVRMAL